MQQPSAPTKTRLVSTGEVARAFGVDPKTVTRWAKAGKIRSVRTPGGHRRIPSDEITRLMEEN